MTELELELMDRLLNRVVDAECEARRYGTLLQSANEAADNAFRRIQQLEQEKPDPEVARRVFFREAAKVIEVFAGRTAKVGSPRYKVLMEAKFELGEEAKKC